jgi:PII-like signaling protein
MRRHGFHSASVLLGLDGTMGGQRRRARLLDRNRQVPLPILAIGERHAIGAAVPEIAAMLDGAEMTLEAVDVLKRDGVLLGEPPWAPAPREPGGPVRWQKLVVHAAERSVGRSEALHGALVRRLRIEGAAGATVLHGHWGFQGAGRPHGERFWSLERHVPALTLVLDTPARMVRWVEIVDEMTAADALVTSEMVSVGA